VIKFGIEYSRLGDLFRSGVRPRSVTPWCRREVWRAPTPRQTRAARQTRNALRRPQQSGGKRGPTSAGKNLCSSKNAVIPAPAGITANLAVANSVATSQAVTW